MLFKNHYHFQQLFCKTNWLKYSSSCKVSEFLKEFLRDIDTQLYFETLL